MGKEEGFAFGEKQSNNECDWEQLMDDDVQKRWLIDSESEIYEPQNSVFFFCDSNMNTSTLWKFEDTTVF